jgi:RNA polymerase sigma-70 factor, ECF subfamily
MTHGTPDAIPPPDTAGGDETLLVEALRERDEAAFSLLLDRWYGSMLRIAMGYVGSRARAEEVVQETWLAVLRGLDRFRGHSSLKTWVFRILVNRARTTAVREARVVPVSSLGGEGSGEGPTRDLAGVAAVACGEPRTAAVADGWSQRASPEDRVLSAEVRAHIERAIEALPARQRAVLTLRDVEGWTSEEVCNALGLTETNQRVLLHRARVKVRDALEPFVSEPEE